MPKSFLQQVARHYAAERQLEDLCFVFPNRRSGKFFEQELARAINGPAMMPRVMTMTDFLSDVTGYNTVAQLEALLVLYKAYSQVMGDSAGTMDTFVRWGSLIVNDFNDADMNLVDVRQLYGNLSDLRKISTDYLTPDLKQAIKLVLNIHLPESRDGDERFWREPWQQQEGDGEVRRAFFTLWERLGDIYDTYHRTLAVQGLHTVGRVYRDAAEMLKAADGDRLPDLVVMVGFSSLSVSELAVFKALQQRGRAHFWWDNALTELAEDTENPAGRMVNAYSRMFPMPAQLEPVTLRGKQVEAVAVPSSAGQAKWAFHHIGQMVDQGAIEHPDNAVNTAIVLPDENLFIPLINSISPKIAHFNVTMGYPLRHSNIVSLMHLVARAHRQATRRAGEWTYFREDVKDIMSHPIIKATFTRQAMMVSSHIAQSNAWNLAATWLCQAGFDTLFQPLTDVSDAGQVMRYIDRLIAFCNQVNERVRVQDEHRPDTADSEPDDDADIRKRLPLQSAFIQQYVDILEQLKLAFSTHGVPATDDTLFYLIDRLAQAFVVPFEGEPVKGMQIMGMQETRSLDFDNIIILSMNERVFPGRHGIASLIPDDLRAAFYMLTGSRRDAIAAYDFYRLIGRASRVALVYNTATTGVGSNEPSRFVTQLKMLYGDRIAFEEIRVDTRATAPTAAPIVVGKAGVPMHDYTTPSADDDPKHAKCLSNSSISEYIECPLKFYLHHVEHLSDNSDTSDFMDYGTFGNIIHDTLQSLYYPPLANGAPRMAPHVVTAGMIEQFKRDRLAATVARNINTLYAHHAPDAPIEGEALILQETIETFVLRALEYDLALLAKSGTDQIEVLECERQHCVQLDFSHDSIAARFNFTYKPDRVDRLAGQLRMVDYKTGRDQTQFKSLDNLFASSEKRCKAIMQLMLYCNAWQREHPADTVIVPVIYKLRNMEETGVTLDKQPFVFHADSELNRQFRDRAGDVIASLFDRSSTYTQAPVGSHCCGYCRFAEFCRR